MPDSTELLQPAADGAAAVREPGVFAAIRQAIRGTRASYDYTEGPIGRAIMLLAIPMVLEMLRQLSVQGRLKRRLSRKSIKA